MDLVTRRRGQYVEQEYPAPGRVLLTYDIPLAELIVDFYDQLKSLTRGYASLDYHFHSDREEDLIKVEILVNEVPVDALAPDVFGASPRKSRCRRLAWTGK